jgi:hypothetical protein
MGVNPQSFAKNSTLQRLGGITRKYEALRHAKTFSESIKAQLRVPGDEFTLEQDAEGALKLRPMQCQKQKIAQLGQGLVKNIRLR